MSSKNKNPGFVVICDEKSGKILDMSPVDNDETQTEVVDRAQGDDKKHHLSNSGTKRPGRRR